MATTRRRRTGAPAHTRCDTAPFFAALAARHDIPTPTAAADAWQMLTPRAAALADLARRLDAVAARLDRLEHPGEGCP